MSMDTYLAILVRCHVATFRLIYVLKYRPCIVPRVLNSQHMFRVLKTHMKLDTCLPDNVSELRSYLVIPILRLADKTSLQHTVTALST